MALLKILKKLNKKEEECINLDDTPGLEKMYDFIKKRFYDVIVSAKDRRLEGVAEFHCKNSYINGLNLEELSPRYDIFKKLNIYYIYLKAFTYLKILKRLYNYHINKENLACRKDLLALEQIKEYIKRIQEDRHSNNESEQNYCKRLKDVSNLIDETIDIFNSTISRIIR